MLVLLMFGSQRLNNNILLQCISPFKLSFSSEMTRCNLEEPVVILPFLASNRLIRGLILKPLMFQVSLLVSKFLLELYGVYPL